MKPSMKPSLATFRRVARLAFLAFPLALQAAEARNQHYPASRPPLRPSHFVALPLGAVKPAGWLRDQLTVQANGLTGHLDEFWPDLRDSAWKGLAGEGWERGPYYLDGLVPLAYLLEDERLKAVAQRFLEWTLASGQPNGWFGPAKNKDRWPLAVAMKVLTQYYEATGDPRVILLLRRYFDYLKDTPPDWPDKEWRGVRAMENVLTACWLYNRTGDPGLLETARTIRKNSYDWTAFFLDFPHTTAALQKGLKFTHLTHGVNIAMALKNPGLSFLLSGEERETRAVMAGLKSLDEHHGQVGGRYAADEHLSGRPPTQGTELCVVVELMFSLENLVEALGDPVFADRLELLAYNANPGAWTADCWAHQYDQQANQVLVSKAKRKWSDNSDTSNLYGLEPHYGCCTANMHQGWPKFVSHLWMATQDDGLAAVAYGPCEVNAKVGGGEDVTIREETDYPFDGAIRFTVRLARPAEFPLHFRIPGWAEGTTLQVDGEPYRVPPGKLAVVKRTWRSGDRVELMLPMRLRTETRFNQAVSIFRGPLLFSLKMGEQSKKLAAHHPTLPSADWEITPSTPWNYGLVLDRAQPDRAITVGRNRIGPLPFAQAAAPVVLRVKGRLIPEWHLAANSAADPPSSPVLSHQPEELLELIPYGCTRLRITEFPVVRPAGP